MTAALPLTSTFVPDQPNLTVPHVSRVSQIRFTRTTCLISPENGKHTLHEATDVELGTITCDVIQLSATERGKTKDVFQVRFPFVWSLASS